MTTIGIDIIEINRFKRLSSKKNALRFFLTPAEQDRMPKNETRFQFLAGRFAAKEAVIKAAPVTITPLDFEIVEKKGKPFVSFGKKFRTLRASCSISHEKHYAAAVAIVTFP
jgi:holo-[acyl-carrier protein] synthase